MKKIKIAILGASEIAFRRFLPALMKDERFEYVGVAYYREQDALKAQEFQNKYGGLIFHSFEEVFDDDNIDAVYVPQPPALHFQYGKKVLESKKHLFMEKPFTTKYNDTCELLNMAKKNNLAVTENYMFKYHKQIQEFIKYSNDGTIGKVKEYRVKFCFPLRDSNDFRYIKKLGGGALLDCGGYTILLSDMLTNFEGTLFPNEPIYESGFEVDMHGSGKIISNNLICNYYYGMNDKYECSAYAFGEKGVLFADRIFTAPPDYNVIFLLKYYDGHEEKIIVGNDDTFLKSINSFYECIVDDEKRLKCYNDIERQSNLIEQIIK